MQNESTEMETSQFETERVLTPVERASLYDLIGIANAYLIDRDYSRQAAIDALSIASVLIANADPDQYGIAPGNVPSEAFPPSYDVESEEL